MLLSAFARASRNHIDSMPLLEQVDDLAEHEGLRELRELVEDIAQSHAKLASNP
jgi:hypothetical protein